MDAQPENDVSETLEVTPTESTEKLSPQGMAAMQGDDITSQVDLPPESNQDISPPPDKPTPPPSDHRPSSLDPIESSEKKKETVQNPEAEPGSLQYKPSGHGPESRG